MTTGATTLLGLALPVQGELSGTWGDTVNNAITQIVDASIAGTQTITLDDNLILSTTTGGASYSGLGPTSAQYAVIRWAVVGGTITRYITAPSQSKVYVVINDSATQSIVLRGDGTTGITLVPNERAVCAWNSTDFIKIATNQPDGVTTLSFGSTGLTPSTATSGALVVAGTLVAGNGGTGYSTYASGDLLYSPSAGSSLSKLAISTAGKALVSSGTNPSWVTQYVSVGYVIDGGGLAITTGIKGDITIPFAGVIDQWTLLADASGSIVVDVWKDTYANYPPTVADSITASAKPTITSTTKGQSSTLTGWTTTVAAGSTLRFNVDSCTNITRVTLSLRIYRS
jgi:hypothetical protein